jgi:SAM-dependent methyltransferase
VTENGSHRARVASEVAVDWTRCFGYEGLVAEEIEHYSNVEVTEDLKLGGVAANRAWERWYRFLAARWATDFVSEIVAGTAGREAPRLLSLGCGHGGMEIDCARRLAGRSYEILALDLNPALFRRARGEVDRDRLRIDFQAIDLNFVELEANAFDVVFAHASLHHLLNLEHLFAQVSRALKPGGRFVVLDIIGKTQVLFWPENIQFATRLVAKMPQGYRRGLPATPAVLFPSYLEGADLPGMEGIRQEEVEAQIRRHFSPVKEFKYNSFVRLICTHPTLAYAFDVESAEDRDYLDGLFRLDLEQIVAGRLRASEMFAVYEKDPAVGRSCAERAAETGDEPRVSIFVVADCPRTLGRCLASIAAQTHRNFEVFVLVTDGGTELGELPGVHLVETVQMDEEGVDLTPALDAASGDYVALLSGCDAWFPIKLATQVSFMEQRPEVGLVHAPAVVVDERGRRTSRALGSDVVGEAVGGRRPPRLVDRRCVPRSTALLRCACCRELAAASGGQLDEESLWRGVAARWPVGFQARPLGMLRAPDGVSRRLAGRRAPLMRRLAGLLSGLRGSS